MCWWVRGAAQWPPRRSAAPGGAVCKLEYVQLYTCAKSGMELRFLRDTAGREVDFVVLKGRKPLFAVEAKTAEQGISPAVRYFQPRVGIPRWYHVHLGKKDVVVDGVRLLPLAALCTELGIP